MFFGDWRFKDGLAVNPIGNIKRVCPLFFPLQGASAFTVEPELRGLLKVK